MIGGKSIADRGIGASGRPERSKKAMADAVSEWRARWSVPRQVYVAFGDNRMLLDLDVPEQLGLLLDELIRLPSGHSLEIQEALPGPSDGWLKGPTGAHLTELVVPLRRTSVTGPGLDRSVRPNLAGVPRMARLRPPGSDWLYLKVYGPTIFASELIAGPVRAIGEFAIGSGLCDGWYFLRYSDPDPHLRLRFHGQPEHLVVSLLPQLCAWADELVVDGGCTSFNFDTYDREIERYGGQDGMRAAEAVFIADSPTVAEILGQVRDGHVAVDLTTLAVVSADTLAAGVGLAPDERLDLYRKSVQPTRNGGTEYRKRQQDLRRLLGRPGTAGVAGPLARVLAARAARLDPVSDLLDELTRDGRLGRSRSELCESYIHLHLNRLLGVDRQHEKLVMELLGRTRESLRRAPLDG